MFGKRKGGRRRHYHTNFDPYIPNRGNLQLVFSPSPNIVKLWRKGKSHIHKVEREEREQGKLVEEKKQGTRRREAKKKEEVSLTMYKTQILPPPV